MEQMRIGTSHASIDIKIYHKLGLYVTSTILKAPFLSKLYILCSSACDNQPLVVKLPKQYKNKEGVKTSTIVFTQTIVLVSEQTL